MSPLFSVLIISALIIITMVIADDGGFAFREASLHDIQSAFEQNRLTSRELVQFYIAEIQRLNGALRAVIEVNPDALYLADKADQERRESINGSLSWLHGVPIILKDNIATKDKLNTTAGSYALLNSVVPQDATVVKMLRKAGAIILGKASMTEWAAYRSTKLPNGWNARGGQTVNPYVASADPCGSSTGSAVSVAANMAAVSLGTETAGSILCPSDANSVVGIKPTVGLTSRAGVVPISPRQDTVGPICRTVHDAVYVLDTITGFDPADATATQKASRYIPQGGYLQFLKPDGLKGKRLGISRSPVFGFGSDSDSWKAFQPHFNILREKGAVLIEGLEVANLDTILSWTYEQFMVMNAEFKLALNAYLKQLIKSPVRSLADAIEFNKRFSKLEKNNEYGQDMLLEAQKTNGIGKMEKRGLFNMTRACRYGFERLMQEHKLDALLSVDSNFYFVLGQGGYPGISVPGGYDDDGRPFGITFSGLKGTEPKLIEIAYSFEQATNFRKPPKS